jgi:hypothetical protein
MIQLASLLTMLMKRALLLAHHYVWWILSAASTNLAQYDLFQIEKYIAVFAIFRGHCQDTS